MKVGKKQKIAFWGLLGIFLTSCTTVSSTYKYYEPEPTHVDNELVIERPFSEVWDSLVKELAKSFFVINNVEKESRIINVSFLTNNPEDYIDCGRSHRTSQIDDESFNFNYPVAHSNSFIIAAHWGTYKNLLAKYLINRKVSLEGRVNIYVAPQDEGTVITANARYVFSSDGSGTIEYFNGVGTLVRSQPFPGSGPRTLSFNTNQPGSDDWGTPEEPIKVKCHSTGALEGQILRLVKPNP